jgi:hypothetical protein
MGWGMAQMVKHLPSKHRLWFNLQYQREEKKKQYKKFPRYSEI